MKQNVGFIDRATRFILGFVLLMSPLLSNSALFEGSAYKWGAVAIGVILIATAGLKFCPLYRMIGIRTCKSC